MLIGQTSRHNTNSHIETLMVAGLARNQKIGVYVASALRGDRDTARSLPTRHHPNFRWKSHPRKLLQPCQEYRMTEAILVLTTSLIIYV